MRNDRDLSFNVGSNVSFQYPIKNVNTGKIIRINGEYIIIEIKVGKDVFQIERYPNEIVFVNKE